MIYFNIYRLLNPLINKKNMEYFYPMCSMIQKYPQDIFNHSDYEGNIYNNSDIKSFDNYEYNDLKEYSEYLVKYEKDPENNISSEIGPLIIKTHKEMELPTKILQTEDIKLIVEKNIIQTSTSPTTNNNIEKIVLISSQNDKIQELDLKLLNKKTKESNHYNINEQNDKGHKRFNILTRFKTNLFINIQENLIDKLMQASEFCKIGNKFLNKIDYNLYIISKASENIDLFNSQLKEVYSKYDKHNEEVIASIMNANDSPLVDVLTKTIQNLKNIFIGEDKPVENYYSDFINSYKILINKLRIKKDPKYVEDFQNLARNIEVEYNKINKHSRRKRGHKKE